jgi:Carboxypeptidase regulatory-like domain
MLIKKIYVSLILLLAVSFSAFSQETTSEIQGLITDASGKAVAGASVIATHVPSSTKYSTTSRNDGRFNLPNLKVGGPYEITVTNVGYKLEKQDNVTLLLGQDFNADFTLTTEAKELNAVVINNSGQNKVFNTSHTGSQEVIGRAQIERLPTINRSLQDFTRLSPSAVTTGLGNSFGGRNNLYNNVTVDGANFNNAFGLSSTLGGQTASQPISLDAIEQVQVNISPYDVKQGGFSGAGINSVTRSGTNEFKGTIYTYLRDAGLQGYDVRTSQIPRTTFNYNLRGAAVGGPIIKDKLFFFVSGEEERITQPATTYVAAKPGQTPVPGVISQAVSDTLDALKNFLVSKYNYNPGSYQDYSYRTYSDKVTVRIDWNINAKSTLTLKYNYLKSYKDIPASNSGAPNGNRQPSNTGLPFSGSGYTINNNFNIFIAEINTRFSNKASNKFQIGYSALRDFRSSLAGGDFPLVDILNSTNQTYTSFGFEPFTYNNKLNSNIFQVSDIFTYYAGKHELTIGTQDYQKKFLNGFAPNYEGAYIFNSFSDFYASAGSASPNAKSYGLQYSLNKDGSFPFAKIGVTELGFFLQDKWRLKNNFTVTYGLRADAPVFENSFQSNPNVPGLTFRDGQHYDAGQKPNTNLLLSPRAGFNWDVFNNQKTQVRGGVGEFSGPPPFVYVSNQASNNGVQFGSFANAAINPATGRPYIFSNDINAYRPTAGSAPTTYNLVFTAKNFKYPQVLKSSIGIDQKLPGGIIGTAEFVYNAEINAINFENVNLPSTGTALAGPDNRIRYASQKINGGVGGATETNPNITNAILMKNYSKGYSYFFTIQLQKTFAGFYTSVAYTNSKSKSINDGGSIAASTWRDRQVSGDPNSSALGYSNYYQPNRVIAQLAYRKEYGGHYATSVGLVFEAAPNGVGSYTYNGDVNNDGTGGNNDLIYIPKTQADIVLVPVNTGGGGAITDTRTSTVMWNQLNAFINQDPYMSKHRGQIAQRNAAVLPYFKHLDLNITQDLFIKSGKNRHTLRLSFDMINLGNFLDRNWGITKVFSTGFQSGSISFLKYEGLVTDPTDPNVGKPRYSFLYQDPANQIPFTNSYQDNSSILSRWQGQVGIRYLFN